MNWLRRRWYWLRKLWHIVEDPIVVCNRDHAKDHVCWDHLTPDPLPGDEVWFCNKCKRSWTRPNHRPSRCVPSRVWIEHQSGLERWTKQLGPMPQGLEEMLNKQRKDRDAKSNHK